MTINLLYNFAFDVGLYTAMGPHVQFKKITKSFLLI